MFLNHAIACCSVGYKKACPAFATRYVFPDGELFPINKTLCAAEKIRFEVRDVENLREHYSLTLRHWVRRLESNRDEAVRIAGEVRYRIWRLYMSASAYRFGTGYFNVFQSLFVKPERGKSGLPLTRSDWYTF